MALCTVLAVAAAATLLSQEPAGEQTQSFGTQVEVEWVLVPVTVRTPKGFATDLEQRRFELLVDGQAVRPESFESDVRAPVQLIFLQDLSGSMGTVGRLERSAAAVRSFLRRAQPGDRFALGTFAGGKTRVDVPVTTEEEVVEEAVAGWRAWGTTALHDAIAWIPEISGGSGAVKPAAVLITDGVDNASVLSPTEAREIVRRARIPVFVIGLNTGSAYLLDAQGEKVYRYSDALNLLAELTGAKYYPLQPQDPILLTCDDILEQVRHQYVLGFPTSAEGKESWHTIRVRVAGAGRRWEVQHRQGYTGRAPLVQ